MALHDDIRRFVRVPLLAELEEDALRLIAFSAESNILNTGDVLFRSGEIADCGFFVVSGSLMLEGGSMGQYQSKIIGVDTLVGEMALIAEIERSVTASAREPSTLLRISRALFRRVLEEFPESAARARILIKLRLRNFAQELDAISKS